MIHSTEAIQPIRILPILLEGAHELLGAETMQQVLDQYPLSLPGAYQQPQHYAGLISALEQRFGVLGGRGMAQRIGRAAFKYLLHWHGDALGFTSAEFRLQRAPQRLKAGLHLLAEQIAADSDDAITISDTDNHWVWRSERCPVCWGLQMNDAGCYLTVGLIQGFFTWAGGGRFYAVTETECRAAGAAACSFWIEKKPLA